MHMVECSIRSFCAQRFQKLVYLYLPADCFIKISWLHDFIYGPLSDGVHKSILVSIHITVLDLEPNLDFQTFLIISKTYHRIFNSNTSKRRSGQELPFIFFELRAPTCLWGRYDPKTENFTLFYIYLLHIHSFSKHFTSLYRATLVPHFMFWLLRCMLWLERIMSPNLKFPSLLKHYWKSP